MWALVIKIKLQMLTLAVVYVADLLSDTNHILYRTFKAVCIAFIEMLNYCTDVAHHT